MELGILLNPQHKHEALDLHQKFATEAGFGIRFLTFHDLAHVATPPAIIHNRTYARTEADVRLLKNLERKSYVFNGGNRFAKSQVHAWLMQNPYLRPNLPATERATVKNVRQAMRGQTPFVLKPDYGATGKGVSMLWRKKGIWYWQQGNRIAPYSVIGPRIETYIRRSHILMQQRLPLAEAFGHVYDIRVSVQRGELGTWRVTGMVGKHASTGRQTTNLARAGKAFRVDTVLPAAQQEVVAQFAIAVALQLSMFIPRLADLGLDIGVNAGGFPMLIECNFRDMRYSFLAAGMTDVWQMTYRNPIMYARSIASGLGPAV